MARFVRLLREIGQAVPEMVGAQSQKDQAPRTPQSGSATSAPTVSASYTSAGHAIRTAGGPGTRPSKRRRRETRGQASTQGGSEEGKAQEGRKEKGPLKRLEGALGSATPRRPACPWQTGICFDLVGF